MSSSSAPEVAIAPTTQTAPAPETKPDATLAGVVAKKPFIALSNPLNPPVEASVLLLQHARTDSPVPLELFDKQKTHLLPEFNLRRSLTAADLETRLGPPAQLADYADPWVVYRMPARQELWLHFDTDTHQLTAADVITAVESGFTRHRVFDSSAK